jgi:predicted nucleotidyltransferase
MSALLAKQPPYLSEVVDRIVRKFHPEKIILFGSWAHGVACGDSDLDLLVVISKVEHKRKAAIEVLRVLNGLPISKDVIVTTPQEIEERGKIIGDILRPALEEVIFPKNHDLDRLRDLLPKGWKVKEEFPDLGALTIWSVESRYLATYLMSPKMKREKHSN